MHRVSILALAIVAGCQAAEDMGDAFPVRPGGGGGGGMGGRSDAAFDGGGDGGGDGADSVAGVVCVVTDLRRWTLGCATSGVAGLTVTIGAATTTTADNGAFQIVPPAPPGLVRVSGTGVVTSTFPYTGQRPIAVVAPTNAYWDDVIINNSITIATGNGSAIVAFQDAGAPAVGALATSSPPAGNVILYDGTDSVVWDEDATGLRGIALVPNLISGDATVTGILGPRAVDVTVPIEEDGLAFGLGTFPP